MGGAAALLVGDGYRARTGSVSFLPSGISVVCLDEAWVCLLPVQILGPISAKKECGVYKSAREWCKIHSRLFILKQILSWIAGLTLKVQHGNLLFQ